MASTALRRRPPCTAPSPTPTGSIPSCAAGSGCTPPRATGPTKTPTTTARATDHGPDHTGHSTAHLADRKLRSRPADCAAPASGSRMVQTLRSPRSQPRPQTSPCQCATATTAHARQLHRTPKEVVRTRHRLGTLLIDAAPAGYRRRGLRDEADTPNRLVSLGRWRLDVATAAAHAPPVTSDSAPIHSPNHGPAPPRP